MEAYSVHRCEWIQKIFVIARKNFISANGAVKDPQ